MSAPEPKEIREAFADYRSEWRDIYEEGAVDMRYISGDPWDAADRDARKQAGRPCLSLDELNQYLNQYCNNLRQSNRAIEVMPKGDGANDDDAKNRQNIIRGIEDESNAQGAYITAGESAASRGYGFAVIRTEYNDEETFNQSIRIQRIANPDMVLLNPSYKQADASDVSDAFLLDLIPKAKFKQKYPDARETDFSGEAMRGEGVSDWVKDKYIQVGEYWKIEHDVKEILLVGMPEGNVIVSADEFKEQAKMFTSKGAPAPEVKRRRRVEIPRVVQYMTNGLEVLDEVPWAGSRIPIISCFGKELYLNTGATVERRYLSMVRLARDAQMYFAYLVTQECEIAGQIPKVPFLGAVGQFKTDSEAWENVTKIPHAYLQYDTVIDGANGAALPPPQKPNWEPNFQQYELAKDSARRSIQAAMGITPLPTAAQRDSEKSGVALEKIETQESVGSFHFSDNYNRFLHNMGWQINELITPILDTQREAPITKPDGTHATMPIVGRTSHPVNDDGAYEVRDLDPNHYHTGKGKFDVTISEGPSYQSEREEQSEFVDHLIGEWQGLGIPPGVANKMLAKAIRMKDLGPLGDDIANLLDPPDPQNLPPEAQAIVAQLQGQMQQLAQENQALHMDRAGRVLEQQTKVQIEQMRTDTQKQIAQIQNDIKILVAEIQAKSQNSAERIQMYKEFWLENHGAAHEHGMQIADQAHERRQAEQAHEQAKELATQQGAQALVQQQAAAEQQPNQS